MLSLPSPWDVARGTCCRALKVPGHQLALGSGPGCWQAAATACPCGVRQALAQPRLSLRWQRAPGKPLAVSPSAPGPSPPRPLFLQVAGRWEGWECGTGTGAAAARRVRPQDGAALLRLRPGQLPDQRDAHGGWVGCAGFGGLHARYPTLPALPCAIRKRSGTSLPAVPSPRRPSRRAADESPRLARGSERCWTREGCAVRRNLANWSSRSAGRVAPSQEPSEAVGAAGSRGEADVP